MVVGATGEERKYSQAIQTMRIYDITNGYTVVEFPNGKEPREAYRRDAFERWRWRDSGGIVDEHTQKTLDAETSRRAFEAEFDSDLTGSCIVPSEGLI